MKWTSISYKKGKIQTADEMVKYFQKVIKIKLIQKIRVKIQMHKQHIQNNINGHTK